MENTTRKRKAEDDLLTLEETEKKDSGSAEEKTLVDLPPPPKVEPAAPAPSGFAAYAKLNPFQAAAAGIKSTSSFGSGFGSFGAASSSSTNSGGFGSSSGGSFGFGNTTTNTATNTVSMGFGNNPLSTTTAAVAPIAKSVAPIITAGSSSVSTAAGLTINANNRPNFTMPPPLVVPSPKSPKMNPFSSPSPVHNPFMTIVNSKDELWKTMAKDKLTEEDIVKSNNLQFTRSNSSKRQRTFGGGGSTDGYGSETSRSAEKRSTTNDEDEEQRRQSLDSLPSRPASTLIIKEDDTLPPNTSTNEEENNDNAAEDNDAETNDNTAVESDFVPTKTYALPENVTVVTGEEEDECLLQTRAKLYRLSVAKGSNNHSDANNLEWIEVGVGPLKVLQQKVNNYSKNNSSILTAGRLVMRREDKKGGVGTKLLINTRLNQYVTVAKQGEKMVRILCVNFAEESTATSSSSSTTHQHNHTNTNSSSSANSTHVLLSGLDTSHTTSSSSPSSSSRSTSTITTAASHHLTATSSSTTTTATNITPQTYLLKLRDAKDCEEIIELVNKFHSHHAAATATATAAATGSIEEKTEVSAAGKGEITSSSK